MTTMVERGARAIYEKRNGHFGFLPWAHLPDEERETYRDGMRAALEAMREIPESAAIAGARSLRDTITDTNQISRARCVVRDAIGAALSDEA